MTSGSDNWLRFLCAAVLLCGTALFLHAHSGAEQLPDRQQLASFPHEIGNWKGVDQVIEPTVREVLGDGDFLSRIYERGPREAYIDLFLAYFPTQRTGDTAHSPQHCLPGAGWTTVAHSRIQLGQANGKSIMVNDYLIAQGLDRELVLYWYQSHGRVVASEYWTKFYLVLDAIRMNRSDGALVRVITPLGREGNLEEAQRRAVKFAEQILPVLDPYIPR